jgi:hypothetical protein
VKAKIFKQATAYTAFCVYRKICRLTIAIVRCGGVNERGREGYFYEFRGTRGRVWYSTNRYIGNQMAVAEYFATHDFPAFEYLQSSPTVGPALRKYAMLVVKHRLK